MVKYRITWNPVYFWWTRPQVKKQLLCVDTCHGQISYMYKYKSEIYNLYIKLHNFWNAIVTYWNPFFLDTQSLSNGEMLKEPK